MAQGAHLSEDVSGGGANFQGVGSSKENTGVGSFGS